MSISQLMDHKCDIYHVIEESKNPGYGLQSTFDHKYAATPDIPNQECHFNVKSGGITIVQKEPQAEASGRIKLNLPAGVDIRINDKVISRESGLSYRAEIPRNIRNHHMAVYLNRESGVRGAI